MSGWNNKETVLQFIEMYRTLPALWKVKSKEYSNKLTREQAYGKLIEFCRTFDPSVDKQFVVNKINNLRSANRKELKKVEASKLSGAGREDVYESRLWYFPYLMFIQDQELRRSGISNLDTSENVRLTSSSLVPSHSVTVESEVPMSPSASSEVSVGLDAPDNNRNDDFTPLETLSQRPFFSGVSSQGTSCSHVSSLVSSPSPSHSQGPSPGPSHSQGPLPVDPCPGPSQTSFYSTPQELYARPASKMPSAKRPSKRKSEDEEILNAARARLLNQAPPPPLDENESFGKTIALLLRHTPKEQRIYARKLMYEVMAEAELGHLSQASYFVASPDFSCPRRAENVQNYQSYYQTQ